MNELESKFKTKKGYLFTIIDDEETLCEQIKNNSKFLKILIVG